MKLLCLLAYLALSASANVSSAGKTDAFRLEERTPHLAKRSRPKCGPKLASADTASLSASSWRNASLGFIRFERNSTAGASLPAHLKKRMELPDNNMGIFYQHQLPHLSEPIVPHEQAEEAEDMSTAVMKTFGSLGRREQYSTGTAHLCGCTTMYIISHKAVYATHWWENVSFDPDPEWLGDRTEEQLFQSTVLDMLTKGGTYHPRLDASLIEDNYIKAYLIHPTQTSKEEENDEGYKEQWEAIRSTVGKLVPTLQDEGRWTDIPYEALEEDDERLDGEDGTAGKNLFKYDPLHIFEGRKKGPLAMMWAEDRVEPWHRDQWVV
ncbi:hypothetical protein BDW74DRAFT_176008 [Aspergillus multicolor]|uniref:uncharacterized protein n=1 Tax=Aspergillus multicolor TaxID=41759 RepID=UPI003CCE4171